MRRRPWFDRNLVPRGTGLHSMDHSTAADACSNALVKAIQSRQYHRTNSEFRCSAQPRLQYPECKGRQSHGRTHSKVGFCAGTCPKGSGLQNPYHGMHRRISMSTSFGSQDFVSFHTCAVCTSGRRIAMSFREDPVDREEAWRPHESSSLGKCQTS